MKGQRGVTLIELMIALSIVAIVAAIAIPSFQDLVERNRLSTSSNELLGLLQLARAEAIKTNRPIFVGVNTSPTDPDDPHLWVWKDALPMNGTYEEADDVIIRQARMADGLSLTVSPAGSTPFSFRPTGMSGSAGTTNLRICDTSKRGRSISVLVSGSIRGEEDSTC